MPFKCLYSLLKNIFPIEINCRHNSRKFMILFSSLVLYTETRLFISKEESRLNALIKTPYWGILDENGE